MNSSNQRHCRRAGLAMIVALSLLIIVGATLTVMAATFGGGVRRANSSRIETQLRQLLVAGEAIAQRSCRTSLQPSLSMRIYLPR